MASQRCAWQTVVAFGRPASAASSARRPPRAVPCLPSRRRPSGLSMPPS